MIFPRSIIIIVAYPLVGTIGMRRLSKHAKYLIESGWEVYLLAVKPDSIEIQDTKAPIVMEMPPENVFLVAPDTEHTFMDTLLNVAGGGKGYGAKKWIAPAVKKAVEIIQQHNIGLIYSSSLPIASAIVAAKVQRLTGIPWVAEFRDLWANNIVELVQHKKAKWKQIIEIHYEKYLLSRAGAIVTVSEPLKEILVKGHNKPTEVVFNGFDEEDFVEEVPLTPEFTITYTGSVYGLRDATPLFKAVKILSDSKPNLCTALRIRFYGRNEPIAQLAKECGIEQYVQILGEIPYKQAIKAQMESHLLLFLDWMDPKSAGIVSGKIFEYLASRRPILSLGISPHNTLHILQETKTGVMLSDPSDIANYLEDYLLEFQQGKIRKFSPDSAKIYYYTRAGQVKKLESIFKSLLQQSK